MSPRTAEQFEEIREEKKQLIMDTALALFANNGYHNTSIGEIAKQAGISKGLIYNYFDSKEQLLQAIVFSGMEEIAQYFDPNRDGILEREELHYLLKEGFRIIKEKPHVWKLYFGIMLQSQVMKLVEKEIYERGMPYFNLLVNYFKSQNKADPVSEARHFSAISDGIALHYVMDPDNYPLEASLKKLIDMY